MTEINNKQFLEEHTQKLLAELFGEHYLFAKTTINKAGVSFELDYYNEELALGFDFLENLLEDNNIKKIICEKLGIKYIVVSSDSFLFNGEKFWNAIKEIPFFIVHKKYSDNFDRKLEVFIYNILFSVKPIINKIFGESYIGKLNVNYGIMYFTNNDDAIEINFSPVYISFPSIQIRRQTNEFKSYTIINIPIKNKEAIDKGFDDGSFNLDEDILKQIEIDILEKLKEHPLVKKYLFQIALEKTAKNLSMTKAQMVVNNETFNGYIWNKKFFIINYKTEGDIFGSLISREYLGITSLIVKEDVQDIQTELQNKLNEYLPTKKQRPNIFSVKPFKKQKIN